MAAKKPTAKPEPRRVPATTEAILGPFSRLSAKDHRALRRLTAAVGGELNLLLILAVFLRVDGEDMPVKLFAHETIFRAAMLNRELAGETERAA